jgi:predicted permease
MRSLIEWTRRLFGSVGGSRPDEDLEEELRSHLELAREEEHLRGTPTGDTARAARLRAGGVDQALDRLRDQRGLPTLDALIADVVFGWRQIVRHRTASASAVLVLGLALGATMAAFRLIDAVLLRPLPVLDPSQLFAVTVNTFDPDGRAENRDDFDYPTFRKYADAVEGHADVMLIGMAARRAIRIDGGDPERAVQQFVSGNVFATLGLQPVAGRLLGPQDDVTPDGHPVAVISHHFWQNRFAGDPNVIGRRFQIGARVIEIVGITPKEFTGTEPGALTDFFLPSMMNPEALNQPGWSWFRMWIRPDNGSDRGQVQALLQAQFRIDQLARVKTLPPDTPRSRIDTELAQQLELQPAGSGISGLQKAFRRPLWILAGLAALLLLIACANVANILLARAMSRRTEMALRISIGATRARLVRLMLVESALLSLVACALAALFAAYSAPFVVSMLAPEERPVRLVLDLDWRSILSGGALTLLVTTLFAVPPALRASTAAPIGALKDRQRPPRRFAEALVAAQMALCVFLLLGTGLFVGTFDRLLDKPLGFEPRRVIHMTVESRKTAAPVLWQQLADGLRNLPGVESTALAGWAPLSGNRWRSSVTIDGQSTEPSAPNWVAVSPGYFGTLRTRLIAGREFRPTDAAPGGRAAPTSGVAIVNEAFARAYMGGRSPVGRRVTVDSSGASLEIVGLTEDAVYFSVRETPHPALFIPLAPRNDVSLFVRVGSGDEDLRPRLRAEVQRLWPGLVIYEVDRFETFVSQQMVRERLLAVLSTFLGGLALILAVIGMYGVLNYSVSCERRQIGVRMALGARPRHVLALITHRMLAAVGVGALLGLGGGLAFGRTVQTLLFGMGPNDPAALLVPLLGLATAAVVATIPPALRAIRIDPAQTIKET